MNVGKRVRALREGLGLTQKEFAAKVPSLGEEVYDWSYIGKIERNDQWPSLKYLSKIALVYNKPLSYFFQDEELKPSGEIDLRRTKVRSLACLVSKYNWELGHFRKCHRACGQEALCRVVKVLVNR